MVRVVIMAGGKGERLLPLTKHTPKPMLQINGRPMLEWIIKRFVDQGFEHFTLCVGHLGEQIRQHFGNGYGFACFIDYIDEQTPLGTAGSLALLTPPDEPIIVINGDVLVSADYHAMLRFHESYKAIATIGASTHRVEIPYGVLDENGGILCSIHEKPAYEYPVGAGVYVLSPESLAILRPKDLWDAIHSDPTRIDMPDFLQSLVAKGKLVAVFPIAGHWLDVGRHDHLRQAVALHG